MSTVAEKPAELKKRTWHYIHEPALYECCCENDERMAKDAKPGTVSTHKVTWSEYEGMLWCYKCKIDTRGFGGIFDGPIPLQATWMIMGRSCFYRYNMVKKIIEGDVHGKRKIYYRALPKLTKRLLKKKP
jgi:hypothetical protein